MRSLFENITEAEMELSNRLDSLSQDSVNYYSNRPVLHSSLCTTYNYMLITRSEEGGSFFDLNIYNYTFSYLVNSFGIVKIGNKIYQFTANFTKTIDDGDPTKISSLINATESNSQLNITVKRNSEYAMMLSKGVSTSSFSRSKIGDNGRNRVIVYQDWVQNNGNQAGVKATQYKLRVRSLKRRLFGAWYDNDKRPMGLTWTAVGNTVSGQLPDQTFANNINYTFTGNNTTQNPEHTWDRFVPDVWPMNQNINNGIITTADHPTLSSSSIVGTAGNVSATSIFP